MLQFLGFAILVLAFIGILVGYRLNKYNVSGVECGIVYVFLILIFIGAVGSYAIMSHATSSTRNAILDYKVVKSVLHEDDKDTRGPLRRLFNL